MFDIIGDIHGHADALRALLEKMGYEEQQGAYHHPDRKVIFVGDYIDRGPKVRETLHIVRNMVEADQAIALMGNHEYNFLCFNTLNDRGVPLRNRGYKNTKQVLRTLREFQNRKSECEDYLDWYYTLPLFYEDEHIRVVHACWYEHHIDPLRQKLDNGNTLNENLLIQSARKGTDFYEFIEETLKGPEFPLPGGKTFKDVGGHIRSEIRIKWWIDPQDASIRQLSVVEDIDIDSKLKPGPDELPNNRYYPVDAKPVFFGHYWLNGTPDLYRNNVCCLDYSIAEGGKLVAYRYDGESRLDNKNLYFV